MKLTGKVTPLHDKILISDMEFGEQRTASGIYVPSDDAKSSGIHPRWGRVWAIGPDQKDVKVGDWVCIEHGRWSRGVKYENEDGSTTEIRLADNNAILMSADEKPNDVERIVMGAFNLNIPS